MAPVDIPHPQRFTAGTVGEPGQRVFFLQAAGGDGQVVTLRCEKQQVGALTEHLARLVSDLAEPDQAALDAADVGFVEPTEVAWVLGRMGVAWDAAGAAMVLVCEELVDDERAEIDPGVEPASVRLRLSLPQVVAFVDLARELLAAGRPPCYLCGLPMEPTGHPCPRLN
jgi:uncharacterized repeat protein (TIGR03847 family)